MRTDIMDFSDYAFNAKITANIDENEYHVLGVAALGLAGESGEVADIAKKIIAHGHSFDNEAKLKIAHELGDILWYIWLMSYCIDYSLVDIARMNIKKLSDRYPDGFDIKKSKERYNNNIGD